MFLANNHQDYHSLLLQQDVDAFNLTGFQWTRQFQSVLAGERGPTPLHNLPFLASALNLASIHVKDEGLRYGIGSFKALGGAYAMARLITEEASMRLGRQVRPDELMSSSVRAIAANMTFCCATDGNHGRAVAWGAQLLGTRAVIVLHAAVSAPRAAAISRYGAELRRFDGCYDEAVANARQLAAEQGWIELADTSRAGYERIPSFVMQGYTVIVQESWNQLPKPPTHVFVQAGVGGLAGALAAHLSLWKGSDRPWFVVVEPDRAACLYESLMAGRSVALPFRDHTVMAMLECYEPSLVAWRILSRTADAFMTVEESDAVDAMKRLAYPSGGDPPIVSGESGAVGLSGLCRVVGARHFSSQIALSADSRVLIINTEGATDPILYEQLVGRSPIDVAMEHSSSDKKST